MYEEFYGFSGRPFDVTPDLDFLFLTAYHRQILEALLEAVRERREAISITGDVGLGKTTLVHSLISRLEGKRRTVWIFRAPATFEELLLTIVLDLNLALPGKEGKGLLDLLDGYLTRAGDDGVTLVIEEAQDLPEEVLAELGGLYHGDPGKLTRFQIIFVGQPDFENRLLSPRLRHLNEKVRVRRRIPALSEKDAAAYLEHRLKEVGGDSSSVFTPDALSMVIDHAGGVPRTLNILCDNALLIGYRRSRKPINPLIVREAIRRLEGPAERRGVHVRVYAAIQRLRLGLLHGIPLNQKMAILTLAVIVVGGFALIVHGSLGCRDAGRSSTEEGRAPKGADQIGTALQQPVGSGLPPSTLLARRNGTNLVERVVVVEKGETLSSIAQRCFGIMNLTLVDLILDLNPEISNANLIHVNQNIRIPRIREEILILSSANGTYKVHLGTFRTANAVTLFREEPHLRGKKIGTVVRKVSPYDAWVRVLVGDFESEAQALEMIKALKNQNLLQIFGGLPKFG
jgi:type II secretory pathway predicted ATPase ExeA